MSLSDEDEEILAFLRSEQDAYYRGDFEAFISHWHQGPETHRMISGPHVGTRVHRGWDALLPKFREGFRRYPQDFDARAHLRWENIQIVKSGDMAWISLDQVTPHPIPDLHAPRLGHETKIIKRFGGDWKLICMIIIVPGIGREDVPRIELGDDGKVVGINDLARERLPDHAGLVVVHDRLRARRRAFDPALQEALALSLGRLATNLPPGFRERDATTVFLGEDETGRHVFCWVMSEQERVLVTFDDAYLLRDTLEEGAASFGLSPGQVDVVELLAQGCNLAEAAERLDVTVSTTRTQVRRAFDKTAAHIQAALISTLMSTRRPE